MEAVCEVDVRALSAQRFDRVRVGATSARPADDGQTFGVACVDLGASPDERDERHSALPAIGEDVPDSPSNSRLGRQHAAHGR